MSSYKLLVGRTARFTKTLPVGKQEGVKALIGGARAQFGAGLNGGSQVQPMILEGRSKMRVFQVAWILGRIPDLIGAQFKVAFAEAAMGVLDRLVLSIFLSGRLHSPVHVQ